METSHEGLARLQEFSLSARAWVDYNLENDFIKAAMLNWALAPQILPDQEGAGQSFYVMIPSIHDFGQAIPEGGSQMLPNAMAAFVESRGGAVLTSTTVDEIVVENEMVQGLRLDDGTVSKADRAVVSLCISSYRRFHRAGDQILWRNCDGRATNRSFSLECLLDAD